MDGRGHSGGRWRRERMSPQQEQREVIPAGRDGWGGSERERVAWQRAEERLRWERVSLGKAHSEAVRGIEREAGAAYRDGMEGSQERAELAARTGGMSAHYDPPIDGSALRRSVMQERMEQMREVDGEQAYEKMMRAVERASQPLTPSQFPSRDKPERRGPELGGPERDYGPSC